MGIYKIKENRKVRKHENKNSTKKAIQKTRKKKENTLSTKKKRKTFFLFSYFLVFFYKFSPLSCYGNGFEPLLILYTNKLCHQLIQECRCLFYVSNNRGEHKTRYPTRIPTGNPLDFPCNPVDNPDIQQITSGYSPFRYWVLCLLVLIA